MIKEKLEIVLILKKDNSRLRLSVYRSNQNIYAQVIDDKTGKHSISCIYYG